MRSAPDGRAEESPAGWNTRRNRCTEKAWLGEQELSIAATAWQNFRLVGRGVLVIWKDGTDTPRVEYWPVASLPAGPEGEDERRMCTDYDPEREVVVRIEGLLISSYRIRPEVAPPDAYAEGQQLTQNN